MTDVVGSILGRVRSRLDARALALIGLAACGRVGFGSTADGALDPDVADAVMLDCTTETFSVLPADFLTFGVGTVTVENNALRMDFPGGASQELGISGPARSLVDGSVSLHVVQTNSEAFTAMGVHVGSDTVHLETWRDRLTVISNIGGVEQRPYEGVWDATHTWWRFRATGTQIDAATSADGVTWSPVVDLGTLFPLDSALFDFAIGAYAGAVAPTVVVMDQLSTCTPPS